MIGFLRGQLNERTEDGIVLDVNGVGYELTCSLNTLADVEALQAARGEVQLHVQTYLREDSLSLFGFASALEKRMFLSLVKVNGVGPKMAIKILSAASLSQLTSMIEAGDVKALSTLPKVGKKTAEQLILSLKGKLVLDATTSEKPSKKTADKVVQARFFGPRATVLSALVNLGFRLQDAETVVGELPDDIEFEQGVRRGLQALSGV